MEPCEEGNVRRTIPKSGPTLHDVARLAGVSTITASRALRDWESMSEATRRKVLEAAETVGYRRNPIAASLASASSNLVGVIVPSLANIVFVDVLAGINSIAASAGLRTFIGVSDYDPDEERRLVEAFLAWRPAALILTGLEHDPQTIEAIRRAEIRCIELMDFDTGPIDRLIGFSHAEAGQLSANHLVAQGYRRIGYIGHDLSRDTRAAKRHKGFLAALADAGLGLHAQTILPTRSSVTAGRSATAELLATTRDLDAIYFSNDDMAIGGIFHCMAAGLSVPDDLAVMGFNGLEIGQQLPQPLTTIRTPLAEIGRQAGEAALALAEGRDVAQLTPVAFALIKGQTA